MASIENRSHIQVSVKNRDDLLVRYLCEEAPRHKSFEVEGYKLNALLEDAGLPSQDLTAIVAAHPNPHPKSPA